MMQDQMTSGAAGQKNKTYALAMTALMAAVTCVLAPMAIPIGPVPISLTNLAIYLSLYLLGWKWGTASYVVYMLIGMVGVPVFSGFTGGLGKLAGPTGGYIIGFVPMAVLAGLVIDHSRNRAVQFVGMAAATAVCYALVLPLHGQHGVRRTGPVRVPLHPRRCGQDAAGHDLWAYAPGQAGAGRAVPGLTGTGRGRPAPSPESFDFQKKRLDKRDRGAYNGTKQVNDAQTFEKEE